MRLRHKGHETGRKRLEGLKESKKEGSTSMAEKKQQKDKRKK